MLWNAKNGTLSLDKTEMHYVSFGYGNKKLILLPGLSDGLTTVKGKALLLANFYRLFFKKYTVYMFSRKNDMPESYSIRDMAHDQAKAMKMLGINKAAVVGVSQGGMIAQYLAIDYPNMVEKLVLVVAAPCSNDRTEKCLKKWISFAKKGNHEALMIDTIEKSYSIQKLKQYRKLYPIIGFIGKPSNYDRFLINANAILHFDASQEIKTISCPTLIIGGEKDKIVGIQASYDMKEQIPNSILYIYHKLGHASFAEANDFNQRILNFLAS